MSFLLDRFLERLRDEFPDYPLAVRPYWRPGLELVEHFIDILLVPEDCLSAVSCRAWDLAFEVYGDGSIPFLMTTVDAESSEKYFAEELARARSEREAS